MLDTKRANDAIDRRRLLAGLAASAVVMAAPARPAFARQEATPASAGGAWTFTDDRDITVELPERPERVVAQVTAAAALWDYGIRPVAVIGPQRLADGSPDPMVGEMDLDAVESLGEVWGEFDVELLASFAPDLFVSQSYGPAFPLWYIPDEAVEDTIEAIVPTVGILVQDVPITQPIARFAELAESLGADMDEPDLVADKERFDEAVEELRAAIAEKPNLTVIAFGATPEALYVANPSVAADLVFLRELGLNVVQPENPDGFWESLSWEQANAYPADLILNDARTQALPPEQLNEIPTWRELPAVKAGQVTPWNLEPVYSYRGYAPALEDLAAAIRAAREDVV